MLGYVRPAINFEIRLPTKAWNGQFYLAGCGGFCGAVDSEQAIPAHSINYGLRRGYGASTMDSGHWAPRRAMGAGPGTTGSRRSTAPSVPSPQQFFQAVNRNSMLYPDAIIEMVKAAMVKEGDKVLIDGSVRDNALLEDLAIETMKAGGHPVISVSSDRLTRRSYDEVPVAFDSQPPAMTLALNNVLDVVLSVDAGESETVLAGVPAERIALAAAKQVTLSSANGTKIAFGVDAGKAALSDGAITPEKVKQGGIAVQTWLPAGELLVPVTPGTGEGTIVIDKVLQQGEVVEGLTLTISKGRLKSMTAKKGLAVLQANYDASTGGKDLFSYIDLGLNPEASLPTNTGRIVWMAPGGVTIGLGDNTGWGGTNVSNFYFSGAVTNATLEADGKVIIENGVLK